MCFFPASEKQRQVASRKRFIAYRKRFHEQWLSKSGESWTRKTKASWNCQCIVHAIYYEETHICFFHWTQKAITTFPISLLREGKTVPVPPFRFCTGFQRFTVPTVHRLFDFLPVRFNGSGSFQNLTAIVHDAKYIYIYIFNIFQYLVMNQISVTQPHSRSIWRWQILKSFAGVSAHFFIYCLSSPQGIFGLSKKNML